MVTQRRLVLVAVLLVGTALLWAWTQLPVREWLATFEAWLGAWGLTGMIAFAGVYVVAGLLLGPASLLTLMAGLVYGYAGVPLVLVSATLSAASAFLIARYLAHDRVVARLEGYPRVQALHTAIGQEGWRVVALVRLSPMFPFGLQNYLFGVMPVSFWPFVLATVIGMAPATTLLVMIGALGQSQTSWSPQRVAVLGLGLGATALVVWLVGRRARRVLGELALVSEETGVKPRGPF